MYVEFQTTATRLHRRKLRTNNSIVSLIGRNLQGCWFSTTTGDENVELSVMKCKKRYNHLLKLVNDLWK